MKRTAVVLAAALVTAVMNAPVRADYRSQMQACENYSGTRQSYYDCLARVEGAFGHRRMPQRRHHEPRRQRGGDDLGALIGGLVIGAIIGGVIANQNRGGYYDVPAPTYIVPAPRCWWERAWIGYGRSAMVRVCQ